MDIALCDDESCENENLYNIITEYAVKKDYDIRCTCFTSGTELLTKEKFDLYFLDYLMDEMNGAELGKQLKTKFSNAVTICYLTSFDGAAAEIINQQIYADGFLKKPVDRQQLYAKLDKFYSMSFFRRLELKKDGIYKTVYAQDILYAEGFGKKTVIHFFNGSEVYPYLMSDLEEKHLPSELFCRVHRSYTVNLLHVEGYDSKSVYMKNGAVIPLSKPREFRSIFSSFNFRIVSD